MVAQRAVEKPTVGTYAVWTGVVAGAGTWGCTADERSFSS
jgi:hypothetical protein